MRIIKNNNIRQLLGLYNGNNKNKSQQCAHYKV